MLNYLVLEYLIHITELHCKWLKVNCITITVLSLKQKCQKKKKSNRKVLKFHFLKKERKYQKQKDFKTSQAWVLFFGVFLPGEDFFSCAFSSVNKLDPCQAFTVLWYFGRSQYGVALMHVVFIQTDLISARFSLPAPLFLFCTLFFQSE